jgi:DNA-binding SARP family transcriptional activator
MDYRLLGPLEVMHDAVALELGPPKQRAVLAALLLERGRVVSTDRLVDAVWGANPPGSALGSLQAYLSNLRRILRDGHGGQAPVRRRSPGYLIAVEPDQVDAERFVTLVAAADAAAQQGRWDEVTDLADQASKLWRGHFLADHRDEDWVAAEATRLEELRSRCEELLVTAALAQRRPAEALRHTARMVAEHGLRDRSCWLHMVVLHQAGRTSEALQAFRDHAARLDDELGLLPGQPLRDLQLAILRHEAMPARWPLPVDDSSSATASPRTPPGVPSPRRSEPGDRPAEEAGSQVAATGSDRTPLVGRGAELAAIDALIGEVLAGRPRWLLLSGPAGIGKTRLADEALGRFRARGGSGVWATCPDEDSVPAWWPLRSPVRDLGSSPDELFEPPAQADADAARFVVYERLVQLLCEACARGPLMLVIDDVQWLDRTSLRFLAYITGALRDVPFAVVLCLRGGGHADDVERLLATLARHDAAVHVDVPPLDAASVTDLLARIAGGDIPASEAFVLTQETGGNPFFVTEYARLRPEDRGGEAIPVAVRAMLRRRLARLDDAVNDMLNAAAVLGEVADIQTLADVAELSFDDVVGHLEHAVAELILVPARGGEGFAFAHGLLRRQVLSQLSAPRRQRLHARVAEALAGRAEAVAQRAHHLVAALPLVDAETVVDACILAAEEAEGRSDSDAAARWWGGALTAHERLPRGLRDVERADDLLVMQVEALARGGRWQTVLDVVDDGLAQASAEARPTTMGRLAAVLLRTSGSWPWASYGSGSGALLARLLDLSQTVTADVRARVRVLAAAAVGSCYAEDLRLPERLSSEALSLAEDLGDPDVLADAILGRVLPFVGMASHAAEAVQLLDRLSRLPHADAHVDEVFRHNVLSMTFLSLGDVEAAEGQLRLGVAASDRLRLPISRVQLRWAEAALAQWRGQLDAAEGLVARAYELHGQTELYAGDVSYCTAVLSLRWERGELSTAPELVAASAEPLIWGAAAAVERGDMDAAAALVDQRVRRDERFYWHTLGHLTVLGQTVADVGAARHVPTLVDLLSPYVDYVGNIGQTGTGCLPAVALGRLHAVSGDADAARACLDRAVAIASATGGLPSLLRARLALIELDDSVAPHAVTLDALADEAERLGMTGLARRARLVRRAAPV